MLQGMISVVGWANIERFGIDGSRGFPLRSRNIKRGGSMEFVHRLWSDEEGQDIAEYAVMLAVIVVIVVGTVRLIGSNANNVFSSVASSIQ
jgi:Flp pilus assembly pilin Flp